jgi:hypothetical protein
MIDLFNRVSGYPVRRKGDSKLLDDLALASDLSDLGARAHQIAKSPEGELIDDEASVRRLLAL